MGSGNKPLAINHTSKCTYCNGTGKVAAPKAIDPLPGGGRPTV